MKLLVVANSLSVHTKRFCDEFKNRGCEVSILSATPILNQKEYRESNIEEVEFLNWLTQLFLFLFPKKLTNHNPMISKWYHPINFLIMSRMVYLFIFINRLNRNKQFDGIFATNLTTNGLIISRSNIPHKICSTLGCDVGLRKGLFFTNKFLYRYIHRKLSFILTAEEEQFKNFFENRAIFNKQSKIIYINNFSVNKDVFSPKFKNIENKKKLFGLNDDDILAVCFREPRANFDFNEILIQLSKFIYKYPNFHFAIGTGGNKYPELEKLVNDLNLKDNILFMEKIEYKDLNKYLAQGDIYIDPVNVIKYPETQKQGISTALLESLSCGLIPVIGRRKGLNSYFPVHLDNLIYEEMKLHFTEYLEKAIFQINNLELKKELRFIAIEKSNNKDTFGTVTQLFEKELK